MKNNKQSPKSYQSYKITELKPVSGDKYGRVIINHKLEPHEQETIFYLSSFGFDIDVIVPSNMPGTNNPDLLMMGTFWEMKASFSKNRKTLEAKFHKAVKQSEGKVVFDLRGIRNPRDAQEAEKKIMMLFRVTRGMRRIILIRKGGQTLDILK